MSYLPLPRALPLTKEPEDSRLSILGVKFSNLEWRVPIWSDVFKLGVGFWNSEWRFQIRSGVFEFGVKFWNSE